MKMTAEEFNARFPIGTLVRYWPIKGDPDHIDTQTRSEAWALGHGEVVVSIKGRSGWCCISHMEPLSV